MSKFHRGGTYLGHLLLQPQGLAHSACVGPVKECLCPHRNVTKPSQQSCEIVIVIVISTDIKIPLGQMRNLGSDLPKVTQPVSGDARMQSLCPDGTLNCPSLPVPPS